LSADFIGIFGRIKETHGSRATNLLDKRGSGVVLASYGRGVMVEAGAERLHCSLKGRKQRAVCGDVVAWTWAPTADGPTIESVAARRNLFERIDARGRPEPVANVDRLAVVVAPEPAPDWFLVDRYWAGAHLKDIPTLLIVNKSDLGTAPIEAELAVYRHLGVSCPEVSSLTHFGLPALHDALADGVTLLVGQSGVGKSSIVNALVPEADAQTAELTRDAEGRHTTTTARRYALRAGAASGVVDAPGVRDFAPPASIDRAAERGFIEIHRAGIDCRFKDCRHLGEPGCAVRAAVADGMLAPRRYESYRRLYRLYEKLAGS
jgi:ribosome biogenesis GTPase